MELLDLSLEVVNGPTPGAQQQTVGLLAALLGGVRATLAVCMGIFGLLDVVQV